MDGKDTWERIDGRRDEYDEFNVLQDMSERHVKLEKSISQTAAMYYIC